MTKRMEQADSKAIYKRRKVIVEPVFGHIKNGGFRRFSVRGKDKVAGEFSLVCAAHNIKNSASNNDGTSVSGIWNYVVLMGLKQEKTETYNAHDRHGNWTKIRVLPPLSPFRFGR